MNDSEQSNNGDAAQTKQTTPRRKMTRAEAGRMGGKATRERYGPNFFREIGSIGGKKGGSKNRRG
ncbi:MAG: hypothetical protein ACYDCC_00590 [Actinomycetota bacterium]